nr:hypothetical protein [Paenibacillus sp.]
MILEAVMLQVKPGMDEAFIERFKWETVEDHTVGFRGSEPYAEWKKLLHDHYDPFPTVEHYVSVPIGEGGSE